MRLCNAPGDLFYANANSRVEEDFQPPRESLTNGVGAIVDLVNHLEPYDADYCGGVGGSTHVYWFTYPDGTAQAVSWLLGACADVTVGSGQHKADGSSLHAAFAAALERQRETESPARSRAKPECGPAVAPASDIVSPDSLALSAVVACVQDPRRVRHWSQATLPAGLVRLLNRQSVVWRRGYPRFHCDYHHPYLRLRGLTTWGDRVDIVGRCGILVLPQPAAYPARTRKVATWQLDHHALARLRRLDYGPLKRIETYPRDAYSDSTAPANG